LYLLFVVPANLWNSLQLSKQWGKRKRYNRDKAKHYGFPRNSVGGDVVTRGYRDDTPDGSLCAPSLEVSLGFEYLGNVKLPQ